jgi:hypothetical protein
MRGLVLVLVMVMVMAPLPSCKAADHDFGTGSLRSTQYSIEYP